MDYININKRLKTPIYKQISSGIRKAIQEERLKHNDHLPTEEEICATYNISNIVVKQAYQNLVDEGLIFRIRGKGTYVSSLEPLSLHFNQFDHFESLLFNQGMIKKRILLDERILPYKLHSLLGFYDQKKWIELKMVAKCKRNMLYIQEAFIHPSFPMLETLIDIKSVSTLNIQEIFKAFSVEHEFSVNSLSFDQARLLNQDHLAAIHVVRSIYKKNAEVIAILNYIILNDVLHFEFSLGDSL